MIFINTLNGQTNNVPPVWIMRQAGRYLTEYMDVRKTEQNFINFCLNAEKASQVTCQPINKFGMDASIIFSDILLVLHMLGRKVTFVTEKGPILRELQIGEKLNFERWDEYKLRLNPVKEAIILTKQNLTKQTPVIGFSGNAWTLFTYLTEGGSSKNFLKAREFLWKDTKNAEQIINLLVNAIINFLDIQIEGGADAIMLFDSWAGSLPARFRKKFILDPTKKIVRHIRSTYPLIPIICFPKSIGEGIIEFVDTVKPNCIAVDHFTDMEFVDKYISKNVVVQGNIDPMCLVQGGEVLKKEVDYLLNLLRNRPYIFNLGHGILPNTPEEHVAELVSYIRK